MLVLHLGQINRKNTHLPTGFASHANALTEVLSECLGHDAVGNEAEDTEGHCAPKTAGKPCFSSGKASQSADKSSVKLWSF